MQSLKSGILLKDRVFVPDYDDYYTMLEELGLEDTVNTPKDYVHFELTPANNDPFTNVDDWKLFIDKNGLPEWWNEEVYRPMIVKAVKNWAFKHIHINEELRLCEGVHYVKDCIVRSFEHSTVKAFGNSIVEAYNYSTISAYDNSTVKTCGMSSVFAYCKSKIKAYDLTRVIAYNNSSVVVYDDSTVRVYDNSIIRAFDYSVVFDTMYCVHSNIELFDKAICRDGYNKIYKKYDWELVKM